LKEKSDKTAWQTSSRVVAAEEQRALRNDLEVCRST